MNNEKVIILPNGYGELSYIDSLKKCLSPNVGDIIVPTYPGTKGKPGKVSVQNLKEEIIAITNSSVENSEKAMIISHCSSILPLVSLIDDQVFWDGIKGIILYSVLAEPRKHMPRFNQKAEDFGVDIDDQMLEQELPMFSYKDIKDIPVPVYVVHHNSPLNKVRATASHLKEIQSFPNVKVLVQPTKGYEISDNLQHSSVEHIVNNYFLSYIEEQGRCGNKC